MQLKKYIKSDRRGKEANRLEREAMNDPFLQDALDGFDAVPGNHAEIIEQLSLKFQGSQNSLATPENGQTLAGTNVEQQNDQLAPPNSERTSSTPPTPSTSSPFSSPSTSSTSSSPSSPSTSSTLSTSSPSSPSSPFSSPSTFSTSSSPSTSSTLSTLSTSSTPSTPSPFSPFSPFFLSIAATILLLIGFGTYFLLERNDDPYISAFVTLQTNEEEIEITPGLLPSELAKESESDAQTMEKLTESENANRAALAKSAPAVTSQQASSPAARAITPQTESHNAAPSTPSQTTQKPQSLVEQQEAIKRAENKMDSNKAAEVTFEQTYIAEITVEEFEEDAMFIPLDSIETVKRMAQESKTFTFSGKVVDELGDPLPGVNITNKGTTTSAITDANGTFTIQLTENDPKNLTASYIGFVSKEIDLSDTNRIITLEEDAQLLSEVVIVGYGVQKKNILTGAISKKEKRNDSVARIDSNTKFGEKEFQEYCRQKAGKNACDGKKVSVRVSFFIDASGKPTQIKYERFTCENAKDEIELLLSASPVWTNINRKVTMTIRW